MGENAIVLANVCMDEGDFFIGNNANNTLCDYYL